MAVIPVGLVMSVHLWKIFNYESEIVSGKRLFKTDFLENLKIKANKKWDVLYI
jgi:hypothetical protein